jgi:hypothetical protein
MCIALDAGWLAGGVTWQHLGCKQPRSAGSHHDAGLGRQADVTLYVYCTLIRAGGHDDAGLGRQPDPKSAQSNRKRKGSGAGERFSSSASKAMKYLGSQVRRAARIGEAVGDVRGALRGVGSRKLAS